MPIDANILLSSKRPYTELLNPLDVAYKQQQIDSSQNENMLTGRKMQDYDTELNKKNALTGILKKSINQQGQYDPALHKQNLYNEGYGDEAQAIDKQLLEQRQAKRLESESTIKTALDTVDYGIKQLSMVQDQAGLDNLKSEMEQLHQGSTTRWPQQYSPEGVKQLLDNAIPLRDKMAMEKGMHDEAWKQHDAEYRAYNDEQNRLVTRESNQAQQANSDRNFQESVRGHDIAAGANTITGGKAAFEGEQKLAADYQAESKNFVGVRDAYSRIKEALPTATQSSPSTLAAGTMFMKLLDPGSVVRESELGMALNATGVWDKALNYANTLANGKVLTESQVKEFGDMSKKLYDAAEKNQNSLVGQYKKRASDYGFNGNHVVTDYQASMNNAPDPFAGFTPEEKAQYLQLHGAQ